VIKISKKYKYANGTAVPVARSQEEARKYLVDKMGATKYGVIWDGAREVIRFELHGLVAQFKVPIAPNEKERRRLWRCVILHIKSMWESIRNEMASIEQILLPWILLPDGQTVGEVLPNQISRAAIEERIPELLPSLTGTRTGGKDLE